MARQQYKMLVLVVSLVLALLVASPAVQQLVVVPQTQGQGLTELSIFRPIITLLTPTMLSTVQTTRYIWMSQTTWAHVHTITWK